MSDFRIKGIYAAALTPLSADGESLNRGAVGSVCRAAADAGLDGVFVGGTTGEGPQLAVDERLETLESALESCGGLVGVVFHAGALTTRDSVALVRRGVEAGAHAVAALTPFFFGLDPEAMHQHYGRLLEACQGKPFYIYDIPQFTGNPFPPELLVKLKQEYPHLAGIKASSPDFKHLQAFLALGLPDFGIISGFDDFLLPARVHGAVGAISSIAGVFPRPYIQVYRGLAEGDGELAAENQAKILELARIMAKYPFFSSVKAAMAMKGLDCGPPRRPLRPLTDTETQGLRQALEQAGLL